MLVYILHSAFVLLQLFMPYTVCCVFLVFFACVYIANCKLFHCNDLYCYVLVCLYIFYCKLFHCDSLSCIVFLCLCICYQLYFVLLYITVYKAMYFHVCIYIARCKLYYLCHLLL